MYVVYNVGMFLSVQTSVDIKKVHSCYYYTERSHKSHFHNATTAPAPAPARIIFFFALFALFAFCSRPLALPKHQPCLGAQPSNQEERQLRLAAHKDISSIVVQLYAPRGGHKRQRRGSEEDTQTSRPTCSLPDVWGRWCCYLCSSRGSMQDVPFLLMRQDMWTYRVIGRASVKVHSLAALAWRL